MSVREWMLGRRRGMRRKPARQCPHTLVSEVQLLEPRLVLSGVSAAYAVTQDWVSGFQGSIQLNNPQTTAVANWSLAFDSTMSISSIWDARIVSHSGNHYVVANAGWNSTLPGGGSVSFGFVAAPGNPAGPPSNYVLNGVALGGSTGPVVPSISVADVTANESAALKTGVSFIVSLSAPTTVPVSVTYATSDGSAHAGQDYTATSGTLNFAPGQTSETIVVPVLGDSASLPDETFRIALNTPSGGTLGQSAATATIHDDLVPTPSGGVTFLVTSDWGSGFTGQVTIRNPGASALKGWTLAFDFSGQITSLWNATVVSQSGTRFVVSGASWDTDIPAGGSVSFGFNGSPGGGAAPVTNFVLGGPGVGLVNQNPTAVADTASVDLGQSVRINVLANDSDPDGDTLSVSSATQGKNGVVTVNSDGTITYTPNAGFVGIDTFSYNVSDGRGGTATASVSVAVIDPSATPNPAQVYSPYVDMTLYPTPDLASYVTNAGLKSFTLAFIVADPQGQPSWGGYSSYDVNGGAFDLGLRQQIAAVRALGGNVTVSFGGANGQELAQAITNVDSLKAAYQQVIDAYGLTSLDFDIEGSAEADHASIDRRSQALAALQQDATAAGRPLNIWLTLPVLPTGLTADGLYVVQSAVKAGVHLAGVNVMAMDFGDYSAPNPAGQMGNYVIESATSTFTQLQGIYGSSRTDAQIWAMVGVTPMIGMNDQTDEVFDQTAARQLLAFAESHGMGRISIWSLNRDQQDPKGAITYVEPTSSSIAQKADEFSLIFEAFGGGTA